MYGYSSQNGDQAAGARPTGRRTAPRLRVYIPGRLTILGGNYPCLLEDISQSGARVICTADISKGETGILQSMEIDVLCKIVRAGNGRFGLLFEEEVITSTIEEVRRQNDIHRLTYIREERAHARSWATGKYS
jgi:hypothetical protein